MRFPVVLSFLFIVSLASAQPATSEKSIIWFSNIDTAFATAQQQDKYVFIYFSGSDWCRPCIKLKENVLGSQIWINFAYEHLAMVKADFPRMRKNQIDKEQQRHNEALAEKYNVEGIFPLLVILNADGRLISKVSYRNETPELFVQKIRNYLEAKGGL